MTNGIFDFVNVLIINGGKDLNGWSVIDMYYDEDAIALAKGQQTVRYEHRANITKQMKTGYMYTETPSLTAGNTVATVTNTPVAYFKEVAEDSGSGYRVLQNSGSDAWTEDLTAGTITFINAHTGTIRIRYYYKSGDISNEEFREEAREEIRRQAELTVKESGGLRWKGTSGVRGTLEYNVGNKIKIDDEYSFGDDNPLEELTIKSISQSYNTGGWKTTLSLEEVLE